jgi:riboflavin kinase/FMN adenylyltransferase
MKLLRNINQLPDFHQGTVVAPGNFDGVHLGHQALLKLLKKKSQTLNLPLVLVLFEPQPSEFFLKDKAPVRLSSLREKIMMLIECQVDYLLCLKFNAELAQTPAEDFAENYFFKSLHAKWLLIGEDFRFGFQRLGDPSLLKRLAATWGCKVKVFNDFSQNNQRISSTKIRQALQFGDFETANALLGRYYNLCGRVNRGDGRGRQWGIPTANIHLQRQTLPLAGVFCVKVQYEDRLLNGVANIGNRPTVDGTKTVLEVHLLDFDKSLYGVRLQVFFLHKLRDEVKFRSVDILIAQIRNDIQQTINFFNASAQYNG